MEKMRFSWQDAELLKEAARAIIDGKTGVGDTDTVPGLFAACTANGVSQLNSVKGRSDKPYLILLSSSDELFSFVKQPILFHIENIMEKFWPGPLTLVFSAQEDLPAYLQSKEGGIAIRIPEHAPIRELARLCGGLLSTSANSAGKPTPKTLDEIEPLILEKAAFIVHDADHHGADKPSTILDVTGKHIRVIREGAIPIQELEAVVGVPFIR